MIGPDTLLKLTQVQNALSKMSVGARIVADVIGPTRHGLAVRVGSETLQLETKAPLPDAQTLTLKVSERTGSNHHKVQILAANDQALSKPVQGSLTVRPSTPNPSTASPVLTRDHQIEVQARPIASDGKVLGPPVTIRLATATVIQSPETNKATSSSIPNIGHNAHNAAATESPLREHKPAPTISKQNTNSFPLPSNAEQVGISAPLALRGGLRTASIPSQQTSALLQQGAPISADPSSATINQARATMPSQQVPEEMPATVIGRTSDGRQTILQTDDNILMKIEQPIDLPIGRTLQMVLMTTSINVGASIDQSSETDKASPLTKLIDLLSDIERSGQEKGGAGDQSKGYQLPIPDRNLAAKLLRLIGLQMSPNAHEPDMSTHDRTGGSLPKTYQLQSLLSDIGSTASELLTDGWRSTTLPLGADPAQAVMISHREHYRDPSSDSDTSDTEAPVVQRAVFDVNFSYLGRCQIDALCQEQRFDLIVRSEKPLDQDVQQEITGLFSSACEIAGLKGEIGYHHGQLMAPAKAQTSTKTVMT